MVQAMRASSLLGLVAISLMLSGCLVKAAADVVTAPVRIGARAVDLATTSQSEADQNRGREIRQREEQLGKLERDYRKQTEECEEGDRSACRDANETYAEMQELMRYIPAEPDDN